MSDIHYRSIAEGRLSNELLSLQGQWDDGQKCFRTHERQLQERARTFQHLHQVLQYSTVEAFEEQKHNADFSYPLCLKEKMKEKQGNGGIQDDPTIDEIRRRRQLAIQTRELQEKSTPSHLKDLENQLQPLAGRYNLPTQQMKDVSRKQSSVPESLPTAIPLSKGYSSTLVELKRTRHSAEEEARSISPAVSMMSASPELRSAIIRIFANPEKADAISKQEYDRRERVFEQERLKASRYQQTQLQEERIAVEKELALLQM